MAGPQAFAHATMHGMSDLLKPVSRAANIIGNNLSPLESPSIEQVLDLYRRNFIDSGTATKQLLNLGCPLDLNALQAGLPQSGLRFSLKTTWAAQFLRDGEWPTTTDLFEIANRQLWQDPQVLSYMSNLGWYDETTKPLMENLRYDIPGPSDLVRFSVRHIWEPDLLSQLGYNEEFPGAIIDYWHACKGLDYKLFSGPFAAQIAAIYQDPQAPAKLVQYYAANGVAEPTWAQCYWWAHWVLPSPGQGYHMMFRLDPERDPKWDAPEAAGQNFTYDDLALLLRANDFPPKFRPLLAAIARPIPGIRFLRDFVKQGVYDANAVYEWARRWGYSPKDREDITNDIMKNVAAAGAKKKNAKGAGVAAAAYELGILSGDDFQTALAGYGLTADEVQVAVAVADQEALVRQGRQLLATLRSQYLSGRLTADQVQGAMVQYGFLQGKINEYLTEWSVEGATIKKQATALQLVRYACQGLLDLNGLKTRLGNLGYPADQVQLLVQEAQLCQQNLANRAAAQAQRQAQQTARQQAAATRAQMAAARQAQAALSRHGSPTQLKRWFCEGLLTEAGVLSRLTALGWPIDDAHNLIAECTSGR